jgi:hypothetical protein
MLIGSRVAVVPYSSLYRARFTSVGDVTGHSGERPSRKERDRLTHYSRFPYGIPAPAMSALLALSGQSAPDTIRTAP